MKAGCEGELKCKESGVFGEVREFVGGRIKACKMEGFNKSSKQQDSGKCRIRNKM